jgi:hypothetical protein
VSVNPTVVISLLDDGDLREAPTSIAVPVDDPPPGKDPAGTHRPQEVHVELLRPLKLVGLEGGQHGRSDEFTSAAPAAPDPTVWARRPVGVDPVNSRKSRIKGAWSA